MKKVLSLAAVAAVISGLLVAVAPPAMAAQPAAVKNFHPNDQQTPAVESSILSDRDDGQGVGAHLTAAATEDTERVTWYHCADSASAATGNALTQTELNDNVTCRLISTDLTSRKPAAPSGVVADEAYDIVWDIPAEFDRQRRDVVAVACIGTGTQIETQPNCRVDIEQSVALDDAATETTGSGTVSAQPFAEQTTAGEFLSVCLADRQGGPGDTNGTRTAPDEDTFAEDPCEVDPAGPDVATGTDRAAVDSRFVAFPHGFAVPDNGFVFRATTDATVAEGGSSLFWAISTGDANALGPAAGTGQSGACTNLSGVSGSHLLWECIVRDTVVNAGEERILGIFEQGTGSSPSPGAGYCDFTESGEMGAGAPVDDPDGFDNGNCQLDAHYLTVVSTQVASVTASFQPGNGVAAGSGCDAGEALDRDETNGIESGTDPATNNGRELLVACFTDQSGGPVPNQTVVFQSTGPRGSGIFGCISDERTSASSVSNQGVLNDTDSDGRADRCTTTTGSTGEATALINNISTGSIVAAAGDQTILVCTGTCTTTATPTQTSAIVHWGAPPHHVHLVHANTGTSGDPCHTGVPVKEFFVGQQGTLLACVFDVNNVSTTTTQTNGGRLSWAYTPPTNTASPSSSVGAQPSETDGTGRGTVTVTAIRVGSDFITVSLENDNGTLQCPSTETARCRATVEVRVVPGSPPTTSPSPSTSSTVVRQSRTIYLESARSAVEPNASFTLTGNIVASDPFCYAGQTVTIVRTPIGDPIDETAGTLTSASDGTFSGSFTGPGVYTARLTETAACSAATSSGVTIKEKVTLTLTASRSRVGAGRRVKLTTSLTSCSGHSGTTVALFKSTSGGGFKQASSKALSSSCTATFSRRMRRSAIFQTRWAADGDHAAGVSNTRRVRVRGTTSTTSGGGGF